ncbi:hypothetical protein KC850_04140 [Candidatus Kaiserbacteria bacterium]|nr:hypothetical protein [Candidatus Kaiserbacteria bacterium]
MFKTILSAALLSTIPVFVNAGYSASDYNPDHVPYNFDFAVDRQNCQDELANFNTDYNAIANGYNESLVDVILISGVAWSLDNANNLFEAIELYYSTEFKDCVKDDDRRIRVEAEEAEFQRAVEECDFDYFENVMSDDERMDTYYERMACKEELAAEAEEESEPMPEPEPVYVPPGIVPVSTPEPVIYKAPAEPVSVTPSTVTSRTEEETNVPEDIETEEATAPTSTSDEIIEMTQEEIDRLVEQRVNEALEEKEPEPTPEPEKPSLFKRVAEFLFGWWK